MVAATRTHFRTCHLCEAMCGIAVELEGNRVVAIRGDADDPFSRGHVCPKAAAIKDVHEDPDRLRLPLRRGVHGFEEVSWEEAFEEVAHRIHDLQERHGRSSVAAYVGNPTVHNHGTVFFAPLLLRALRTKNRFSATSVDQLPSMFASHFVLGHQLLFPIPDIDRTELMIIFGGNPLASNGSLMTAPDVKARLRAIQARGGRVVVVDPRRTETAAIADEHVFIRPGTDALMLFAMVRHVLETHGARPRHLAGRVDGLGELRRLARDFDAARVSEATGVVAGTMERLADELWRADAAVCYGRLGTSTQQFGTLCQWLIDSLNLISGNLDRPGGAMFTQPAVDAVKLGRFFGVGRGSYARWTSRVRGLPEFGGELPVATLADEILTEGRERVRGLLTLAGNPVLSTPNGKRLDGALTELDFMVSVDIYLNETTRHAHLILPPPSALERSHYDAALHLVAVRNTAKWSPAAIPPPPDSRQEWEILFELVTRLEDLRGHSTPLDLLRRAATRKLGPDGLLDLALRTGPWGLRRRKRGLSLSRLRESPHGVDLGPLEPCLLDRMPASHARIDLAPPIVVDDVLRLKRRLGSDASGTRPLLLIGRRHLRSNNSWMHNVGKLVAGGNRCTLLVHPDDATKHGLVDGGEAIVRSRVGEVKVTIEATRDVMPGVVSLPHGWGHGQPDTRLRIANDHAGASMNDLTDPESVDALGGNAVLSGVPVDVERVRS